MQMLKMALQADVQSHPLDFHSKVHLNLSGKMHYINELSLSLFC